MANEESTIMEFELSDDLIKSYSENQDITFLDLNVKGKVENYPKGTLLQVTKKIGSPIKIISATEVDDTIISQLIG